MKSAAARGVEIVPLVQDTSARTADDAARAVGVDVSRIVKSLVFLIGGQPVLALVSGVSQLDESALAVAAGGGRVQRASADEVRSATGYAIGGVAPFGSDLPVYMDRDLLAHNTVFAAAGRPDTIFEIDPHTLARTSAAILWDLASAA
ncbi:MAG: YbaK/EbsC family protein [Actinomycetia bacterium]|nr:YbaK/EbsC family protein [Actinomycetes bacterium]MCP4961473.1 YbaK/EbsC family protein [Actinomycetes bacterium]